MVRATFSLSCRATKSLLSYLLSSCLLLTITASPSKGADTPGVVPKVSVALPGGISEVHGMDAHLQGYGVGGGDLFEPHEMTLHFSDGASASIVARSSNVICIGGHVEGVVLRRPLRSVGFHELKADLFETLAGIHFDPDKRMRQQIAMLPADILPGNMPFDTGISCPIHGVVLGVKLCGDGEGGWYYMLIFSAVNASSIPVISPATQPTDISTTEPRDVSMDFSGPAPSIHGAKLQLASHGMSEADLLDPVRLALHAPDGSTISVLARSASFIGFDGGIPDVFLRRPMHPVTFKEARADMLRTLANLHVVPDKAMNSNLSFWPDDVPGYGESKQPPIDYQTGTRDPVHGLDLTVRLCPDPAGGWYYLLIFDVPHWQPPNSPPPSATTAELPK
jgi:hypothetical protein